MTVLNGNDVKPQEEEKINEETEESDNKERVIKLDEVETMSQTEVIFWMFILNNEFQLFTLILENTNESQEIRKWSVWG